MKIAFFGLPLGALLLHRDGHQIGLAVLSPLAAPGKRRLCAQLGPERVTLADASTADTVTERLTELQPDLIVSWFYTQRIAPAWLRLAAQGGIGAHPSLLPRHRGPNPYFACIDQGDTHSGVSIHKLEENYDTGAVLAQQRVLVENRNAWQLARLIDRPSLTLLRATVQRLAQGTELTQIEQDEAQATWAPEPSGSMLHIDLSLPTQRVLQRIRALSPVPGLALEVRGLRFFVTGARAARTSLTALQPGEAAVVSVQGSLQLMLRTGDGALVVERAVLGNNDGEWEHCEGVECDQNAMAQALLRHDPELMNSIIQQDTAGHV